MRSEKSQAKTPKRSKKSRPSVTIDVAPGNGKVRRLVVARCSNLKDFTDTINPFSASARNGFVVNLAKAWGIDDPDDLKEIKAQLPQKAKDADDLVEKAVREAADDAASAGKADPSALALENTDAETRAAAEAFLENPDMMQELADDLAKLGIAGETRLATTEYVIGTSRLLEKPLGGSVKSSTSSGKSYVTEIVVLLMPEEDVLNATDISAQALYYTKPGSLRHKLVCVGERKHANAGNEADAANATLALREMMSRGRLDKYVTESTNDGLATRHVVQEGPIAYIETTTQQEIFEEDATRMLSLATDESPEHTADIMALQARQAAWETETADERDAIRAKHRTAQRLLTPLRVRIRYAPRLALPTTRLVARRAFPQLLAFIEAVALLRQRQKRVHDDGHIDADVRDYEIAYDLMRPVLRRTFAPLGARAEKLLRAILNESFAGQVFTRTDCQRWAGVGATEVRNRITLLVEAGMVEQVSAKKGVVYEYTVNFSRLDSASAPDGLGLITPADLRKQLKKKKKSGASSRKKVSTRRKP